MHLSSGEIIWSKEGTTQGDPLGMTMYTLGMAPLIQKLNLKCPSVNQLWFADNSSAASSLKNLLEWWESLLELGPSFGYEVNVKKFWLVVKPHLHDQALSLFHNTGLQISVNGCLYLGAAIGQKCFIDDLVSTKLSVWVKEIETLSNIAQTQPHAAYSVWPDTWCLIKMGLPPMHNPRCITPISTIGGCSSSPTTTSHHRAKCIE